MPYYKIPTEKGDTYTLYSSRRSGKSSFTPLENMAPGFPMLQVSNFNGNRFCAVKMNATFHDIKMIDEASGKCHQDDQILCPENEPNANNKFCLQKNKTGGVCPITDLHLKNKIAANVAGFDYVVYN